MYQISEFSKKSATSVQTLRYYDNLKLFRPQVIDPHNGYRYYTNDQLTKLQLIKELKKMGFMLKEIISLLEEYDEKILESQKKILKNEIFKNYQNIKTIDALITNMKSSKNSFEKELSTLLSKKERRNETMKENYLLAKDKLQATEKLYKENKIEECLIQLDELKLQIFEITGDCDPFWALSAGDLFTGITFELFKNNEEITFLNIYKFVVSGKEYIDDLPDYTASLAKDSYAYISFGSVVAAPYDTRAAVISVYKQILKRYAMFETKN